jgi:hypothetical protein
MKKKIKAEIRKEIDAFAARLRELGGEDGNPLPANEPIPAHLRAEIDRALGKRATRGRRKSQEYRDIEIAIRMHCHKQLYAENPSLPSPTAFAEDLAIDYVLDSGSRVLKIAKDNHDAAISMMIRDCWSDEVGTDVVADLKTDISPKLKNWAPKPRARKRAS